MSTHLSRIKSDKYLDKGEVRIVIEYRRKVSELIKKNNFNKAHKLLVKYLEKYYQDECLNYMMGQCLLKFRKYDEALIYFNNIPEEQTINYRNYWINVALCDYNCGNYQRSLDVINAHREDILKEKDEFNIFLLEVVVKKNLGIIEKIPSKYELSYLVRQLTRFDKNATLYHIRKKHIENINNDKEASIYTEGIDLNYLYDVIQENIDEKYFFDGENYNKNFCVAIPNIGIDLGYNCNFLHVVLADNKKDIINMFPTMDPSTEAEIQYIDIDYDKLYPNKKDVNKMSKI